MKCMHRCALKKLVCFFIRISRCLLEYLTAPFLRESAAECLREVISKGMEPIPKIELIESLAKRLTCLSTNSDEVVLYMYNCIYIRRNLTVIFPEQAHALRCFHCTTLAWWHD